jgi:hypothetical protein
MQLTTHSSLCYVKTNGKLQGRFPAGRTFWIGLYSKNLPSMGMKKTQEIGRLDGDALVETSILSNSKSKPVIHPVMRRKTSRHRGTSP